ncbi:hypothetical protein CF326_g9523, partial [Tilletia indica]
MHHPPDDHHHNGQQQQQQQHYKRSGPGQDSLGESPRALPRRESLSGPFRAGIVSAALQRAAQEKRFDRMEDGVGEILSLLRKRGREEEDGEEKAGKKAKGEEAEKGNKEDDAFLRIVADTLRSLVQQTGASHVVRSDIEAALERRIGHPVDL